MSKDLRNILIAIGIFLAAAGVAGYFVYDTWDDLDDLTTKNADLDTQITTLSGQVNKSMLTTAQGQLEELNKNFNSYIKILPPADLATEDLLSRSVRKWCHDAHIETTGLTIDNGAKPTLANLGGDFLEVQIQLEASCTFPQFVDFLQLVEHNGAKSNARANDKDTNFSQFFSVTSFVLSPTIKASDPSDVKMRASVTLSTYKYKPAVAAPKPPK